MHVIGKEVQNFFRKCRFRWCMSLRVCINRVFLRTAERDFPKLSFIIRFLQDCGIHPANYSRMANGCVSLAINEDLNSTSFICFCFLEFLPFSSPDFQNTNLCTVCTLCTTIWRSGSPFISSTSTGSHTIWLVYKLIAHESTHKHTKKPICLVYIPPLLFMQLYICIANQERLKCLQHFYDLCILRHLKRFWFITWIIRLTTWKVNEMFVVHSIRG